MIPGSIFKKSLIAFSVVTLVATVGVFGTQVLARGNNHNNDNDHKNGYYSKDQCEDGNWKKFKNPNGSQKFKNQGQCEKFFNHNDGEDKNDDKSKDKNDNNNDHQSTGSGQHKNGNSNNND